MITLKDLEHLHFGNPKLLNRFGAWMRVQAAFYDFLFSQVTSPSLGPQNYTDYVLRGWFPETDETDLYEETITAIEQKFPTFQDAWTAFVESIYMEETDD